MRYFKLSIVFLAAVALGAGTLGGSCQPIAAGGIYAPNNQGIVTQGQIGNNTIYQGPQSRLITEAKAASIIAALKAGPSYKFEIFQDGADSNSAFYASQLSQTLNAGGWKGMVTSANMGAFYNGPPPTGVRICGPEKTIKRSALALNAILSRYLLDYHKNECPPCEKVAGDDFRRDKEALGIIVSAPPPY